MTAILPFLIGTILQLLIYRSPLYTSYRVSTGIWFQEKNFKNQNYSQGGHLGFPLFLFYVTLILSFQLLVNWPFDSGIESQNRFSKWWPWLPSWISGRNFDLQVTQILPFKFRVISLLYLEKKFKITFQGGGNDGHLGFLIEKVLAILYLQVTLILLTKWWPFWISNQNNFSYFLSTSRPDNSFKFRVTWPFC